MSNDQTNGNQAGSSKYIGTDESLGYSAFIMITSGSINLVSF